MTFDIRQLDKLEPDEEDTEIASEKYQDTLIELFLDSPEGQKRAQDDPEVGFWTSQFIYYGYGYIGVTLPKMAVREAEEIVAELFPRKISILSPDDADDAIPELIAFWEYLKREYQLPNAEPILKFLHQIRPKFKTMMNDPANFGMAKSFVMQGQSMGFDMTTEEGSQAFMAVYNASLMSGKAEPPPLPLSSPDWSPGSGSGPISGESRLPVNKKAKAKKKNLRKIAQASRKKNQKKRK